MFDGIRKNSNVEPKIVLTVSPVPLLRTFMDEDIVVAHSYSKSVLRAVAEEPYRSLDYVDDFPSYEMVVQSPPDIAWRHDRRHVEQKLVWSITGRFRHAYVEA